MDTLLQDLRYALRQFVRRPGFTAIAVLSLGLAIGGNSLIYGLLDGFVFHPFPYPQPDRLVAVGVDVPQAVVRNDLRRDAVAGRVSRHPRRRAASRTPARSISAIATSPAATCPERVFTALLLDDLFPGDRHGAGTGPRLHRATSSARTVRRRRSSAIACGRADSAAIPAILNRAIRISGRAASIVGVMPPGLC